MSRIILTVGSVGLLASFMGCANTWDTVSSRKFRDAPFKSMFSSEDPMHVLRSRVEGNERAAAMRRLEEPARLGRPAEEQDEALKMLELAATEHPSPVVRTAAIGALGRFEDPRAVPILISAYNRADGLTARPQEAQPTASGIRQVAGRTMIADPLGLGAPVGFAPEFASTIRTTTIGALAKTSKPEAVAFLSRIALGDGKPATESTDDRDVRTAAVRGLGQMRHNESLVALARVLKESNGRDLVLASRAHEGLVHLTGKDLPPEPEKWNAVVQAGFEARQ